ncbi:MAG TPA: MarR family transcriptional regulator [Bacteroidia bacterium]|nr:MarR family transcriptional regulator [Bacteroidia bacterium]
MPTNTNYAKLSVGTKALILSKLYYSVLSKSLESIDIERYYSILFFLNENNGCNQQCICNNLAIDKTAMVKVIDYLIKVGFVDRNVNPEDRREHFIVLTKKGLKQTAEIVKAFNEIDKEIFSSIPKEEQAIFNKVICQLSTKLKELPANDLFFNYKQTSKKRKKGTANKAS